MNCYEIVFPRAFTESIIDKYLRKNGHFSSWPTTNLKEAESHHVFCPADHGLAVAGLPPGVWIGIQQCGLG